MSEKILEIKDLHVEYKTDDDLVYALNGVNLVVHKGQTMGLVGETGAGKTTTALSIMDLLPDGVGKITQGSIELMGNDVLTMSKAEKHSLHGFDVSMIFQDPMTSLNPILTVGDQIAEVVRNHYSNYSKSQINNRVNEMLSLVGIPPERGKEYPHQFSGGMKQRIVIAMALACNPKLLLADEPTTALDVTIQAQVLSMMNELKNKFDTAMILITHDLGVVAQTCDSVAIMYAGEIVESGTAEDIFLGESHHPYTIGLFGSIPDMTKKIRRLNPIDGLMPDPTKRIQGCPFAERCASCMMICKEKKPEVFQEKLHQIKCHLYARERQADSE